MTICQPVETGDANENPKAFTDRKVVAKSH